ncbi:MAG: alpha/beta fold hydrolase [Burkholderiales bacterium]|nr:alpha/beta fold hydrolase [Burkholderiales bacterium]
MTERSVEAEPRRGTSERGNSPWLGGESAPSKAFAAWQAIERQAAAGSQVPGGALAPATPTGAFLDWALHLAGSPAKAGELGQLAVEQWLRGWQALTAQGGAALPSLPQDKRFADPAWLEPPYKTFAELFLLQQEWWQRATTGVPGVTRHHEQMVSFAARQWLDLMAPSNFVSLNPVVQQRTLQEEGMNLVRGVGHAWEDAWREAADRPPAGAEAFEPGRTVAITPGGVVLRNRLMELIQYAPTTPTVHAEPVLLVPAWIMKYYILDLSPSNSLVRHLVDQGFTVFAISWKNPDADDRDLGMDDYCELGIRAALRAIAAIVPGTKVHATGYCLGGTLLATVAAALGREGESPLRTLSLLAAQTDFTEPGELGLFIDEGQIAFLESGMARRGYLDKRQMAGAFQMLRSNDLIWSYRLHSYLLGERRPMTDLMAWNADGTRLPYRMHIEYLRGMFLRNALARGEWKVAGRPVDLADIRVPIFNVGTVQDHVAPWRSVFKLNSLTDAPQTFVLTAGGHNVGIVNPPGQAPSSYRLRERRAGERRLTPDRWLEETPAVDGSWWTPWVRWLRGHSSRRTTPPMPGAAQAGFGLLEPAPGRYVHQR